MKSNEVKILGESYQFHKLEDYGKKWQVFLNCSICLMQFLVKFQKHFNRHRQTILKFIWKEKCIKAAKTSKKRTEVGILTIADDEAYLQL